MGDAPGQEFQEPRDNVRRELLGSRLHCMLGQGAFTDPCYTCRGCFPITPSQQTGQPHGKTQPGRENSAQVLRGRKASTQHPKLTDPSLPFPSLFPVPPSLMTRPVELGGIHHSCCTPFCSMTHTRSWVGNFQSCRQKVFLPGSSGILYFSSASCNCKKLCWERSLFHTWHEASLTILRGQFIAC